MKPISFFVFFCICNFIFINCNPEKKEKIRQSEALIEEIQKVNISQEGRPAQDSEEEFNSRTQELPLTVVPEDIIDPEKIDIQFLIDLVEDGINQKRTSMGLSLLERNSVLYAAAENQNSFQVQIGKLSHYQTDAVFRDVQQRVNKYGGQFSIVGENVQYQGFQTIIRNGVQSLVQPTYEQAAGQLVNGWIDSPSHYENLISDQFDQLGTAIGWCDERNALFATQVYGGN